MATISSKQEVKPTKFELSNVKLLSKNYDKFFFSLTQEQYESVASKLKESGIKDDVKALSRSSKDDVFRYALSAFPDDKVVWKNIPLYSVCDIRFIFKKNKSNQYYCVAKILSSHLEERTSELDD